MSDHTWTQEHAAAFVAGGLSAEEAERLEAHVRDCPACAAAVSAARDLDRGLGSLFAADRPGPALEDRAVRSFRAGRRRWKLLTGWPKQLAAGIAATVGLSVTGYAVSRLGGPDGMTFPGDPRQIAWLNSKIPTQSPLVISSVDGLDEPLEKVQLGMDQQWTATLDAADIAGKKQTAYTQERNALANASVMANQQAAQMRARYGPPDKELTNEDLGLQSDLAAALPNIQREDKRNIEAAVTQDTIGVPNTGKMDDSVLALPGLRPTHAWFDQIAKPDQVASGSVRNANPDGSYTGSNRVESFHNGQAFNYSESARVNVNGVMDPSASLFSFYVNPYFQGTYTGNQAIPPRGGFAQSTFGSSATGSGKDANSAAGNVPQFFNPATARPALPTQGQATGNAQAPPADGKPADGYQAARDDLKKVGGEVAKNVAKEAQARANPQNPGAAAPANPEPARRVVIRSGDIEFEVDSFDSAVATVTKLVTAINGGFVATVNSEKLPNGKVKGSVTVRVPPEHLDGLVLDLRKELGKVGELKGQKIGSQDVTKQYTDLESRLKAARTMEQRLLQVIKEGKGEIKALLEAERELGVWRTKIEEIEGELRYFSNLAALSTLTVTIAEKEIRAAAGITESERVQAGVEVEDVDKAYQQALAAVIEAKGRVTKSELKQLAAGQFNATLHFEVSPEAAGPMRDRLRQLGRVARLEIDRVQQAEGGTVPKDAKVKRGDTVFLVQLYNLANIAPRETAVIHVAATDVSAAYAALRDAVGKAAGRVITAQLNETDRQNVSAQVDFEVRRTHEAEVRAALDAAGEVVSRQVGRAPESDSVTDTKVLYRATLLSAARLRPREVTTLAVEVEDVNAAVAVFGAQVAEAKGRQVDSQSAHESNGRVTSRVVYEVPLAAAGGLVEKFKTAGVVRVYQSARDPQVPDTRFATARVEVTVSNADRIVGQGVWPQVRRGLSYSASVLLTSLTWVVFGLCVVLPWAIVGYGGYRVVRRVVRGPAAPAATQAPTV
jgi:hypothetical protein